VACPTVSRWASIRLPLTRRFRKPPYDPGRWDFPSPVLTLAFLRGSAQIRGEAQALTCIHPAHAGLPTNSSPLRAQRDLGSVSERRTGTAKYPEPLCCAAVLPPCRRRPASPRRTLLPLHRSYGLMRQTCCPPSGFGIASHRGSLQVAVSPCWAQALPVVISANPSLRVWTSTPAAPRVHEPVTSPRTLAFPREAAGRRGASPRQLLRSGATFRSCSHSLMFRPTGSLATPVAPTSHLTVFGSRGFYVRAYQGSLPPPAADMLSVQSRAIDGRRTCTSQDWQP
jgi:hypothetical protein